MKKEIKLNDELIKGISSRTIKAIDLVKFLISDEGITYDKNIALENTSINMLVADGYKVESAMIDKWKETIVLTLGDKVITTPISENKNIKVLEFIKEEIALNRNKMVLESVKQGYLFTNDNSICLKDLSSDKLYILYTLYSGNIGNDINIHGNSVKGILKDFVSNYTYSDILDIYNADKQNKIKYQEYEENNKCKLEDIKNKIETIFTGIDIKAKINKYNNYELTFTLKENNYKCGYYRIMLEHNGNYYYNDYVTILSENEIIEKLIAVKENVLSYIDTIKKEKEYKRIKAEYEEYIYNIVNKIIKNGIAIIKSKNSIIKYRNGMRFSIKEGTSGRFYNCNIDQLEKLVLKANSYSLNESEYISVNHI